MTDKAFEEWVDRHTLNMENTLRDDLREAYQAGVAQGMEEKWIAVADGLPEDGRVLVFSPIYGSGDNMRYRIMDSQFVRISSEATHWQPLPSPPKANEEKSDD